MQAGVRILAALGYLRTNPTTAAANRAAQLETELLAMIYDSETPSTLGSSLHQVRHLAWLLRDRISVDAWRILNHFDQQFSNPPPLEPLRISGALNLLDNAIMTLSAFSGLAMESMTRGHGWRFLDIGRRLERADQMVEMIRHGLGLTPTDDGGRLEVLLEIADSFLTYRSRYLTSMQPDLVLDLLLLDEANPRSAAFQLARLREHIEHMPGNRASIHRPAEWRLAIELLTAVQLAEVSELVRLDASGRWSNLENLVIRVAGDLRRLSEVLTRTYFTHALASRQLHAR
jgi:uncharacterized alpha-E superfamily protein